MKQNVATESERVGLYASHMLGRNSRGIRLILESSCHELALGDADILREAGDITRTNRRLKTVGLVPERRLMRSPGPKRPMSRFILGFGG
jgi:hypothetical protein